MARLPVIRLKPGRDKSLLRRHPWIFSGAIEQVEGEPDTGATVEIRDHAGRMLALAAFSPHSQIRARVWSFEPRPIDGKFFSERIAEATATRDGLIDREHTACRLVHGESDGLPGLVADRYGDVVVMQLASAGADHWRDPIVQGLAKATGAKAIVERSDAEVRTLEGLPPRVGIVHGTLDTPVTIREQGLAFAIDVIGGQKTGFFLDQRDNRARVRELAHRREVLDVFCYSGGFTLAALAGGARGVRAVDSSAAALAAAARNLALNPNLEAQRVQWQEGDAFAVLRELAAAGERFGLIVLDPPKFAPTAAHAARAARAYKDVNLWALKLLAPGGVLATFSCSGGMPAELFQKVVAGAAIDAGVDAAIVGRMSAGRDHPVGLAFPEGEYLKGLLVQKHDR